MTLDEPDMLAHLTPVTDQEVESFLTWLFGPAREDEMLTETQCSSCGRRHWKAPGKEEEACSSCSGSCSPTGRFQQPDISVEARRYQGTRPGRGIDPEVPYVLRIPS